VLRLADLRRRALLGGASDAAVEAMFNLAAPLGLGRIVALHYR
jgi:hypothetical protein